MKAKVQILFHKGGNWRKPLSEQTASEETVIFELKEGDEIEGRFLGNRFKITKITLEEIMFTSEIGIAKNNENGTINLRDANREFILKINEEQNLQPAVTDSSSHWVLKLLSIDE